MTVIRPNSISGITSLTAHRGSIDFYAHDGSAARFDNINSNVTSGVSTFASLNITGDLDVGGALTYEDVTNVDSIGVVTARNGIDVTGGTVTITTGANSASPAGSGDNLVIKDSNGCGLSILSGNGNSQNIYLGSVSDNDAVRLEGFYNSGSPYFNIYTAGSERLRITSDGNIGVAGATGTDYSLLDGMVINTANGSAGLLINSSSSSHNAYLGFSYGSGSSTSHADQFSAYIGRVGDDNLILGTNNSIRVSIDSTGRLLKSGQAALNSTSLSHPIQVASASDANAIAIIGRAADDIGELSFYEADKSTKLGELQYRQDHLNLRCRVGDIRFASGGTSETLRIDGSGRIAQGARTPTNHGSPNLLLWGADTTLHLTSTGSTNNSSFTGIKFAVAGGSTGDYSKAGIFVQRQDSYNDLDMIFAFRSSNDATGVSVSDEKIRINSDGKLLIGTTSADSNTRLHVSAAENTSDPMTTDASIVIANTQNVGNNEAAALKFNVGNTNTASISAHYDSFSAGVNSSLRFYTQYQSAFNSPTERMRIDPRGRVTMPSQPCAMAYNAQGQHMAGNAVAQFNSTRFNIGNMYNTSNGRMTVPVDGRYLVAYSGLHDYISQNAIGFDIRINGSNFNGGEGYQEDTSSSNSQLSKTLILHLSANDYVEIFIRQSGTQVHQRYGSFSVCLIT